MNIKTTIDDIAAKLPSRVLVAKRINIKPYYQKMQSLRGKRTFYLITTYIPLVGARLVLTETTNDKWDVIGSRNVSPDPDVIERAIKSLEKKAKCKLYYVLLISTDGEYL